MRRHQEATAAFALKKEATTEIKKMSGIVRPRTQK